MANYCVKILVSGKVQGVFFRDFTCLQAQQLQVTGWVRNLANGQVECLACGKQQNVMKLIDWCHTGSPSANVEEVSWEKVANQNYNNFSIQQ